MWTFRQFSPRVRLILLILSALLLKIDRIHAAEFPPPNIIYIMADDLGYGDLGCYGQERIRTPRLDQMAKEGMKFTDFYAGSTVCAPARCVLMTGLHTGHCFIRGNARYSLRPEDVTLPEVLKPAGYRTALIGKWGLGQEDTTGVPTRQGFDEFFGYLDQHHAHNYYPAFLMRGESRVTLKNVVPGDGPYGTGVATKKVEYSHDLMMQETLAFLKKNKAERFFLCLTFTIPHANNEGRADGMEVPDLEPYAEEDWPVAEKAMAAMVTRLDRDIGTIFDRLKEYGIDENTIVFFTSDNGPHREGGHNPDFFDSNGTLKGIKRDLYEGGIRVPLLVRWPGKTPAGSVSHHVGYFADILPTAAALAGVEPPKGIDGLSFLPAILGQAEKQPAHDHLYWEFYERKSSRAIRQGNWKAVCTPFHGEAELYDLSQDIGEEHNIAAKHPDVVAELLKLMDTEHVPSPLWKLPAKSSK